MPATAADVRAYFDEEQHVMPGSRRRGVDQERHQNASRGSRGQAGGRSRAHGHRADLPHMLRMLI